MSNDTSGLSKIVGMLLCKLDIQPDNIMRYIEKGIMKDRIMGTVTKASTVKHKLTSKTLTWTSFVYLIYRVFELEDVSITFNYSKNGKKDSVTLKVKHNDVKEK